MDTAMQTRHLAGDAPDEELVARYQSGDQEAMHVLLERFRDFARMKARSYFLAGAEREDIVQEGMIGLYKAIRDYRSGEDASFRTFAEICITRQVISAVKTASRHKHGPLNTYISLSMPVGEEGSDVEPSLGDVLPAPRMADPAETVVSNEDLLSIKMAFSELLSDLETEVLHLYVEGKSYEDIAEMMGRHPKAVDNALQRIKRKLEMHLHERDADVETLPGPSSAS